MNDIQIPDQPAFDPEFDSLFREKIQQAQYYLEFGSGASTVLAAKAGVKTLCVETDRKYSDAVRKKVGVKAPVTIIYSDIGLTEEWGYPVFTRPSMIKYARWRNYTEKAFAQIEQSEKFPDMVLVDGRFRVACALATAYHAVEAKANCSLYIDDYVGRPHYEQVEGFLGAPKIVGRTACFSIGPGLLKQDITQDVIHEVHKDFR
ncbi:hypothetical protein [Parasphingorhabdus cellanae]|uniref:Class I SAM-dependent methyltransferase n=1 Tax=Parasphingorhabdus cellanae TaxID=2806553 RepID=A0ABX7T6W2_9SPHN|nr:hypothetical protein [Parasphingorhabdus cellanae]QTD56252.1 hypothetical protein J4G78_01200 [Parasphingorhabdus cellanae]